jgi:hypothetical protein
MRKGEGMEGVEVAVGGGEVERDQLCQSVLLANFNEGLLVDMSIVLASHQRLSAISQLVSESQRGEARQTDLNMRRILLLGKCGAMAVIICRNSWKDSTPSPLSSP